MLTKNIFLTVILLVFSALTVFAQVENDRNNGIELYWQGEYEKAVEVLQNSLKEDAGNYTALVYLGSSFVKLKRNDDALVTFLKLNFDTKKKSAKNAGTVKKLPVFEKELKISSRPLPIFPASYAGRVHGKIKLAVEFGADGKVGFAFPFIQLPDDLADSIIEAAGKMKFTPAVIGGRAVSIVKVVEYEFL